MKPFKTSRYSPKRLVYKKNLYLWKKWSELRCISFPQVDDLKAKLATQEVELQKKNEAADKLIRIVEAETAKVRDYCLCLH